MVARPLRRAARLAPEIAATVLLDVPIALLIPRPENVAVACLVGGAPGYLAGREEGHS